MPELPEVEVVLRHLKPHLVGSQIHELTIHRADIVRKGHHYLSCLPTSHITDVMRRGKCLIMTCERSNTVYHLLSELGMTGLWLYERTLATTPQHVHACLTVSGKRPSTLHYWNPRRFGRLWIFRPQELSEFLHRRFGPDPLELDEPTFLRLLRTSRGRIKSWLMNQRRLAGIGNIYANEILFRSGIHPHAKGCALRVNTCRRLFQTLQRVLQEAIQAGGSSIRDFQHPNGEKGSFQLVHQVYQKTGSLCSHGCQNRITRLQGERSSFFCPSCQKRR